MKLHFLIKSLGGSNPVVKVYGKARGCYSFTWSRRLAGHVRTYDFGEPGTPERFEKEQADILGNPQQWPITLKVELHAPETVEAAPVVDDGREAVEKALAAPLAEEPPETKAGDHEETDVLESDPTKEAAAPVETVPEGSAPEPVPDGAPEAEEPKKRSRKK